MAVHPAIRQHVDDYLSKAEFALNVVSHTGCVQNTPALDNVRAALDQVARARGWVKEGLPVQPVVMKPYQLPLGKGLPLTRQQRLGHRWP
ncbi:MAG: hypothetical protein RL091_768 [Verrucomicrobiota bacterium]|jgi:hypothetical protein